MADEKIVVVCVGQDCYKMNNASGVITLITFTGEDLLADVSKGDVVTIEIKRKENIEAERKADIDAENKEYDDITRITRMENK